MNSKYEVERHAVQIVQVSSNSEFRAVKREISKIFATDRVADLPLVVFCIAGAARKGKSFILNFFLDFLQHKEKHPDEPWQLNESTTLAGFEFRDGEEPTTLGIWAWNHIFVIEQKNGQKIAVSLIDSQGAFDNNLLYEDCSTIFAMTAIFSSIMCFNVFTDLQEDKLNHLSAFIDHGKRIAENLGGNGKIFQDFVFIVRDFCFKKYLDENNGGQKYVKNVLSSGKKPQHQQVRDTINQSYEHVFGFVFPNPGEKVTLEKTSKINEINPNFVHQAKYMVETLLSQATVKIIGSTLLRCKDMAEYIPTCIKCFEENQAFAPKDVQAANRNFIINVEVGRANEGYNRKMDDAFNNFKTGYDDKILTAIHEGAFAEIQSDMVKRIKNEEIITEIMEKFHEQMNLSFGKYKDKNALLVENEKKRLQLIEDKEKYEKQKRDHEQSQADLMHRNKMDQLIQQGKNDRQRAEDQKENQEKMKSMQEENDKKLESMQEKSDKKLDKMKEEHEKQMSDLSRERERDKAENDRKLAEAKAENDRKIANMEKKQQNDAKKEDILDFMKLAAGTAFTVLNRASGSSNQNDSGSGGRGGGHTHGRGCVHGQGRRGH